MATLPKNMPGAKQKQVLPKLAHRLLNSAKPSGATARPGSEEERSVSASNAKTHLLELLDTIDHKREGILITKRGRPVARLVPVEKTRPKSIFGCMKGTGTITGDIVGPEPDVWNAIVE